jgi:hypothetical protein
MFNYSFYVGGARGTPGRPAPPRQRLLPPPAAPPAPAPPAPPAPAPPSEPPALGDPLIAPLLRDALVPEFIELELELLGLVLLDPIEPLLDELP